MKRLFLTLLSGCALLSATAQPLTSPNGKVTMTVENGKATLMFNQQKVMDMTGDFSPVTQAPSTVTADYTMLAGKRRHCANEANEYQSGSLTVRLYNDGVAIRESQASTLTYLIPEGMKRWMEQWTDSYEGFFPLSTTYKVQPVPSFSGISKSAEGYNNRWGYPALLEAFSQKGAKVFALITEANILKGNSASCLFNDGERYRVVPDEAQPSTISPQPWRVIIVGSLADIVESTLVTDVSEPSKIADTSWIHPGVVSWVYWAYNHGSNDYQIIKQYVDLAVSLHLPYVLIDAEWDGMKDGYTIEHAIRYAKAMGVKPLIWYNSSVGWVDGAPTPKFRLNKPEDREKEFAWCERLGVAGVKIDFFSGDNQKNMDYCIDLLECAARHHLLVNFHGATVPRGWQRTYPNLLSTEGVYGAEWYNNVPTFTDKAASHNATLPFTRNVIGPMDYTPCAFSDSQHPHITSHAHELALTVLFESGLQHLADRPESFLSQPAEIRQFLSTLPAAWDDTRFVCGYPGEYAVLARRSGDTWYLAGINGTDQPKTILLPNGGWNKGKKGNVTVYADGSNWQISTRRDVPKSIKCIPRGGFIVKITPQ
ncbi:MAG: glycoside hydrolase family 97 protein [Prevotella sp.]|nr:glycoside hydrolase family 97 protein [Prevotella sp.]